MIDEGVMFRSAEGIKKACEVSHSPIFIRGREMTQQEVCRGFRMKGLGITMYCHIRAVNDVIRLTFGKKLRTFCISITYDHTKPTELCLDRVESAKDSIAYDRVTDLERDAVRCMKLVLYMVKQWFPRVIVIRFADDSKIICRTKPHPLMLSHEYITKYGKTWFEYHFHASIDESRGYDKPIDYYHALEILTQPHRNVYRYVVNLIPAIIPFEAQYVASTTPREFLENVRIHLGDSYWENGSTVLIAYLRYLRIHPILRWKILMNDVENIPDVERKGIAQDDAIRMLNGGYTRRTRRNQMPRYQFSNEVDFRWYAIWE